MGEPRVERAHSPPDRPPAAPVIATPRGSRGSLLARAPGALQSTTPDRRPSGARTRSAPRTGSARRRARRARRPGGLGERLERPGAAIGGGRAAHRQRSRAPLRRPPRRRSAPGAAGGRRPRRRARPRLTRPSRLPARSPPPPSRPAAGRGGLHRPAERVEAVVVAISPPRAAPPARPWCPRRRRPPAAPPSRPASRRPSAIAAGDLGRAEGALEGVGATRTGSVKAPRGRRARPRCRARRRRSARAGPSCPVRRRP